MYTLLTKEVSVVASLPDLETWRARLGGAVALLPVTFTLAQARTLGVANHVVYALRDAGLIEPRPVGCTAARTASVRTWGWWRSPGRLHARPCV